MSLHKQVIQAYSAYTAQHPHVDAVPVHPVVNHSNAPLFRKLPQAATVYEITMPSLFWDTAHYLGYLPDKLYQKHLPQQLPHHALSGSRKGDKSLQPAANEKDLTESHLRTYISLAQPVAKRYGTDNSLTDVQAAAHHRLFSNTKHAAWALLGHLKEKYYAGLVRCSTTVITTTSKLHSRAISDALHMAGVQHTLTAWLKVGPKRLRHPDDRTVFKNIELPVGGVRAGAARPKLAPTKKLDSMITFGVTAAMQSSSLQHFGTPSKRAKWLREKMMEEITQPMV